MRTWALLGLSLYFVILMTVVLREKRDQTREDYFFAGRELPFWALSLTFVASWWGAGSALSTADLAYDDGLGAFVYYGVAGVVGNRVAVLVGSDSEAVTLFDTRGVDEPAVFPLGGKVAFRADFPFYVAQCGDTDGRDRSLLWQLS